ncbi:MAG: fumarylacetoacetate hydrolase family protein, partial [Gammaproteobacteria bacterium]
QRFPVNRIYCVGRNYAAHAREMGANPERESPFFFSKPANAVAENGAMLPFPSRTQDLHHEVELVVALAGESLDAKGSNLSLAEAGAAVYGYAVGIDFTRRDLQAQAKDKGRPWDTAKGFDDSAPITAITPVAQAGAIEKADIRLAVNGELRQQGQISDLIWSIPELIAELSTYYRLRSGDLIFTGTPSGVAAVQPGDVLEGHVDGLETLRITLGAGSR